jgi:ubiquinol-cytochrome c reductase iron-sulfur subunit
VTGLAVWRGGGLRRPAPDPPDADRDPSERRVVATAPAELLVAALLIATMLAGLGFVALFILDAETQLLALTLGGGLAMLGAALAIASSHVVPQETAVEERPIHDEPSAAVDEVAEELHDGAQGITRRRLLGTAAGAAGVGLTAAVVIPVVALGPGLTDQLSRSPWHAGRLLVDEKGTPVRADDLLVGSFLTAFPQGADMEQLTSPVVVVRVDAGELRLPRGRAGWAPHGIVAYSKICTHAGCAVSLFRSPLSPSTESGGPALVCPCHYSTFDVLDGASVEFGPAGRPLPQLPLAIDPDGRLRAGGPLSGPVGPSWWGDAR